MRFFSYGLTKKISVLNIGKAKKMKILHICMCDPYAEDWSYHRNTMSEQNHKDGHDVAIITTQYTMGKDGESLKVKPGTFYTTSGDVYKRQEQWVQSAFCCGNGEAYVKIGFELNIGSLEGRYWLLYVPNTL